MLIGIHHGNLRLITFPLLSICVYYKPILNEFLKRDSRIISHREVLRFIVINICKTITLTFNIIKYSFIKYNQHIVIIFIFLYINVYVNYIKIKLIKLSN